MNEERDIFHPEVLFVMFDKAEGGWQARIPNAYGPDKPAVFDISEDLSLQFQPVEVTSVKLAIKQTGVRCFPLVALPESEDVQEGPER